MAEAPRPSRAEVEAMLPKALAFVRSQGGYADAELVDRVLGPLAVGALLLEASRDGRVEAMGGFLMRRKLP